MPIEDAFGDTKGRKNDQKQSPRVKPFSFSVIRDAVIASDK